jgi:hypothetical protein
MPIDLLRVRLVIKFKPTFVNMSFGARNCVAPWKHLWSFRVTSSSLSELLKLRECCPWLSQTLSLISTARPICYASLEVNQDCFEASVSNSKRSFQETGGNHIAFWSPLWSWSSLPIHYARSLSLPSGLALWLKSYPSSYLSYQLPPPR